MFIDADSHLLIVNLAILCIQITIIICMLEVICGCYHTLVQLLGILLSVFVVITILFGVAYKFWSCPLLYQLLSTFMCTLIKILYLPQTHRHMILGWADRKLRDARLFSVPVMLWPLFFMILGLVHNLACVIRSLIFYHLSTMWYDACASFLLLFSQLLLNIGIFLFPICLMLYWCQQGVEGIKEYGIDKLIQVAASQLSDQLPESREAARTLLLELQSVYEKSHGSAPATVSDSPEMDSWENFCQSKLSPLSAQAVLRVTNIAREGLVIGSWHKS